MTGYRCYFLTAEDKISAVEEFTSTDDDAAIATSRALFATRQYPSFELWRGDKKIYGETSRRAM
jgi:hypothetical protein